MTEPIHFHIPGQPVGKGRPIAGKAFGSRFTTLRTPAKTVSYESTVALFAAQAMAGRPLLTGPVNLQMRVDFAIPASWSQKKQRAAEAGLILPTVKPDADNILKALCDAINGVVWKDDVQVVDLTLKKRYSVQPGVAVRIDLVEGE